ncbi:MAG: replication-associated recombination protein A [Clostridia bacterium]|nr:replication-associated recombination protein A [Clostridia bacterium]
MATPLADRLRPKTLDEIVGQKHLIGENKPLSNIINSGELPNLIFYGPPGTGKTTVAEIAAGVTEKKLFKLNGTTASIADVKKIVASLDAIDTRGGILLYLDEIQYFNKKQQQILLQYIEDGRITLIASTTENPYFYVYSAVLSRSTVFEFKSVDASDIKIAVLRAFNILSEEMNAPLDIEPGVIEQIANAAGGDVRSAINNAEAALLASPVPAQGEPRKITLETAVGVGRQTVIRYDKLGEEHYDLLSAFQKSMRGSDANAAIHYLARILEAGDLASATRRLMVCACEDVGLAYPQIIPIVKAAVDIAFQVGLPEARIPLADAVVLVCNSPKSNSAYNAINLATEDLKRGKTGPIPRQLQNKHYDGADAAVKGQFYKYPHNFENHWVRQQYLPDAIKDAVYYEFGDNKNEQAAKEYWSRIKKF